MRILATRRKPAAAHVPSELWELIGRQLNMRSRARLAAVSRAARQGVSRLPRRPKFSKDVLQKAHAALSFVLSLKRVLTRFQDDDYSPFTDRFQRIQRGILASAKRRGIPLSAISVKFGAYGAWSSANTVQYTDQEQNWGDAHNGLNPQLDISVRCTPDLSVELGAVWEPPFAGQYGSRVLVYLVGPSSTCHIFGGFDMMGNTIEDVPRDLKRAFAQPIIIETHKTLKNTNNNNAKNTLENATRAALPALLLDDISRKIGARPLSFEIIFKKSTQHKGQALVNSLKQYGLRIEVVSL